MTPDQLAIWVLEQVPEIKSGVSKQFPEFIVPIDKIHEMTARLKAGEDTKMDYLFCQTAVDRKDGFHVVYHLTSSVYGHSIVLRVILPDKTNPAVISVSDIWKAAEFYEREIFDLFGIHFENHPDLRRIFLDDDWIGFPLRKDYKDNFTLIR